MAPLLENPKSFSLHSPKRFGEPPILESRPSGGPNSFEATDLFVPSSANGIGDLNEVISQNRRLREAALSRNSHDGGGIVFGRETMTQNSGSKRVFRGVVKIATGAATTQLDSPLPGPADVVGAGIISSGVKDVGLGFLQLILPKSSFELPKDWPNRDEESKCKRGHVLHRAVPRAEKQSIEYEGKFVPNPTGSAGKYFSPTRIQVIKFANSPFNIDHPVMWRATGVLPPGVLHDHINPVGEGQAVFITNPQLKNIVHARTRERIK